MAVRVFIKRHIREGQVDKALRLLAEFRKSAMNQPGHVSGETLINHYDPGCVVVVATWANIEDWVRWQNSEERDRNESMIEDLLDKPTVYEVFDFQGAAG